MRTLLTTLALSTALAVTTSASTVTQPFTQLEVQYATADYFNPPQSYETAFVEGLVFPEETRQLVNHPPAANLGPIIGTVILDCGESPKNCHKVGLFYHPDPPPYLPTYNPPANVPAHAPEPGTAALGVVGLFGVVGGLWRRKSGGR